MYVSMYVSIYQYICLFRSDDNNNIHLWTVKRQDGSATPTHTPTEDTPLEDTSALEVIHIGSMCVSSQTGLTGICFSKDQALLVTGHNDGSVKVWDIQVILHVYMYMKYMYMYILHTMYMYMYVQCTCTHSFYK